MAERSPAKTKRSLTAKTSVKAGDSGAVEAENARLKAELAEALERLADLELKHADVVDRIDRVIDSLHKLPE